MSLRRSLFYSAIWSGQLHDFACLVCVQCWEKQTLIAKSAVSRIFFYWGSIHSRHIVPRHLSTSGWKTTEKSHKMQEKFSTIIFSRLEGLLWWYLSLLSTSMPWVSVDVHMYIGPNQVLIFWLICHCWSLKIVLHKFLGHCILNYL